MGAVECAIMKNNRMVALQGGELNQLERSKQVRSRVLIKQVTVPR